MFLKRGMNQSSPPTGQATSQVLAWAEQASHADREMVRRFLTQREVFDTVRERMARAEEMVAQQDELEFASAVEEPVSMRPAMIAAPTLAMAKHEGLLDGETRHVNARIPARLLERATEKAGVQAVTDVLTRALAALATGSDLGPWLVANFGALSDIDPAVAALIDDL